MTIVFNANNEFEEIITLVLEETLKHLLISTKGEVSVSFVSPEDIQALNNDYRNKNTVTDVLSFPLVLSNENIEDALLIGDIVICLNKAKEQAVQYNHSLRREVAFLTVHSMLHLLGYDHLNQTEEEEMFSIQENILNKLNINR